MGSIPLNYTVGAAAVTFAAAFLIFLGVLVFVVAANGAFVSFPMFYFILNPVYYSTNWCKVH
jgi:hypothetical protein